MKSLNLAIILLFLFWIIGWITGFAGNLIHIFLVVGLVLILIKLTNE